MLFHLFIIHFYQIILDFTRGIAYMHTQTPPVLHCDIRTPNVLVVCLDPSAETCVKLGDVGNARVADVSLQGGTRFDLKTDVDQYRDVLIELKVVEGTLHLAWICIVECL